MEVSQLGSATTASVQVEDNDEPAAGPTISITRSASSVTEGGQVQFRLTSTQVAPTNGLSVNVNVSGGDAFLADTAPTAVQIAYNSDSATLTLPTSNDECERIRRYGDGDGANGERLCSRVAQHRLGIGGRR